MYILKNDRLLVEVSKLGAYYNGARFDWNGFITQITLDGQHTFCVPESLEPGIGSGGCGLCGEFGIDKPIGYDDTSVGDYFIKIGVGLLKKADMSEYDFFKPYEIIQQSCDVIVDRDAVTFSISTSEYNGYAYDYQKKITVAENRLEISYLLHNTGTKKISTNEYCHNFIGIDTANVDSSYSLTLPCEIRMEKVNGKLHVKDNKITWLDTEMKEQFYCQIQNYDKKTSSSWELYNHKVSIGVRETNDFPVYRFALWGYKHVISPEAFINIELEHGQTQKWTREYEFFK